MELILIFLSYSYLNNIDSVENCICLYSYSITHFLYILFYYVYIHEYTWILCYENIGIQDSLNIHLTRVMPFRKWIINADISYRNCSKNLSESFTNKWTYKYINNVKGPLHEFCVSLSKLSTFKEHRRR